VRYELGFYVTEVGIPHSHRRENLKSNNNRTEEWCLHSHRRESLKSYNVRNVLKYCKKLNNSEFKTAGGL
jgi:hypothetical protein